MGRVAREIDGAPGVVFEEFGGTGVQEGSLKGGHCDSRGKFGFAKSQLNHKECFSAARRMRSFAAEPGPNPHGGRFYFKKPSIVILREARAAPGTNLRAMETMTHELSHREFKARLKGATVPAWFNEGMATYLGKEEPCTPAMHAVDKLSELDSPKDWMEYTNQSNTALINAYCQARNEVDRWTQAHGGFSAVLTLLNRRARGESFDSIYGG